MWGTHLTVKLAGLVAMRVYALFGGGFVLKVILWACWFIYAAFTSFLLGYGLWKGDRTYSCSPLQTPPSIQLPYERQRPP